MHEDTYRRLAAHLDRLPGGFGSHDEAAEQRLLRVLFTPEEAELATHLTLDRETAAAIGARAGLDSDEAESRLEEMARKGLIFPAPRTEGERLYQAVPFVLGIYEFQVNRLSEEFLVSMGGYMQTMRRPVVPPPQMRTIPIGKSIRQNLEVLPYQQASGLVAAEERFAVAPCICRRAARMAGGGCEVPEESCLAFGEWAAYYAETGRGRAVDREEALALLDQAEEAGLVLQPTNSQKPDAICTCCSCCCGMLAIIRNHPRPADIAMNAFQASFQAELCEDCGTCLERCPMGAVTQGEGRVEFQPERCIGCGLCVSTCPSDALTLTLKPASADLVPLSTLNDAWRHIVETQSQAG